MRTLCVFAALLALVNLAQAQPELPGPSPVLRVVTKIDKGKGTIEVAEVRRLPVQSTKLVTVIIDGQQVQQAVREITYTTVTATAMMNVAESRVITPNGKDVPVSEVWKRLKLNMVLVVSQDDNIPAQPYLRALASDCLVLIPPAQKGAPVALPQPVPKATSKK
jgi:hypothetical protein